MTLLLVLSFLAGCGGSNRKLEGFLAFIKIGLSCA